jgi:hypothetical protein
VVAVPVVQRLVVGAVVRDTPLAVPQVPVTGTVETVALQDAVVPPFAPVHDQVHGPVPATVVAVPAVQRPVVGVEVTAVPLVVPQEPLVNTRDLGAVQLAVVPPLIPVHDHVHGPVPATVVAVPVVQRPVVGVESTATPLAVPQAPLAGVAVFEAVQLAVVPPPVPVHDHVHGPVPATVEAVPTVQRPVVGIVATVVPLAVPQVPLATVVVIKVPTDIPLRILYAEVECLCPPRVPARYAVASFPHWLIIVVFPPG